MNTGNANGPGEFDGQKPRAIVLLLCPVHRIASERPLPSLIKIDEGFNLHPL